MGRRAAKAIPIKMGTEKGLCYYQGGCYFDVDHRVEILAYYDNPYDKPAMIKTKSALLCGFHPEFSWENLGKYSDPTFRALVDILSTQGPFRRKVWQKILDYLSQE